MYPPCMAKSGTPAEATEITFYCVPANEHVVTVLPLRKHLQQMLATWLGEALWRLEGSICSNLTEHLHYDVDESPIYGGNTRLLIYWIRINRVGIGKEGSTRIAPIFVHLILCLVSTIVL